MFCDLTSPLKRVSKKRIGVGIGGFRERKSGKGKGGGKVKKK